MVYREQGITDLQKVIDCKMVNYWARIVNSKESKFSHIMYNLLKHLHDNNMCKSPWI